MDIERPQDRSRLEELVDGCQRNLDPHRSERRWRLLLELFTRPSYEDSVLYLLDHDRLAGFSVFTDYTGLMSPLRLYCDAHLQAADAFERQPEAGRAVGGLVGRTLTPSPHTLGPIQPDDCYLGFFAIDDAYRGQGLGSLLLEETERQVRVRGAQQFFLHSTVMGRALYRKNGFEPILEIDPAPGKDVPTLFMGKRLR